MSEQIDGDGFLDIFVVTTESRTQGGEMSTNEENANTIVDVRQSLVIESVQAHQTTMNESKTNAVHGNALLRAVATKKFDQVDAIESSAVEKVLQAGK